jgi:tetratricopeptide (TPR) repeat protein
MNWRIPDFFTMMNRITNLIILVILLPGIADLYGQMRSDLPKAELDSLIMIIQDFQGTELVDHLNLIATSVSQCCPDSCFFYATLAEEHAEKLEYIKGKAEVDFSKGNGYYFKNDIANALIFYFKSLALMEQYPKTKLLGDLYTQIGLVYYYHFSFESSRDYLIKAEKVFKSVDDSHSKFYAQRMIFHTFLTDSLNEEVLPFIVERLNFYKNSDKKNYNRALNEMGLVYLSMRDSSALGFFMEGIEVAKGSEINSDISVHATNIGCFYTEKPNDPYNFNAAEHFFKIAIESGRKTDRYALLAETYMEFGILCVKYNLYEKADSIFKNALALLQKFDSSLLNLTFDDPSVKMRDQVVSRSVLLEIYQSYVNIYHAQGDYKNAFEYEVLRNNLHEWIQINRVRMESELIHAEYEAEKINRQIAYLSTENELQHIKAHRSRQILVSAIIVLMISGLFVIMYLRSKRFKAEHEKTQLRQRLLRSQMNPHFIFNSLASVQNFIVKQDDTKASIYLSRFSELVRSILNNSLEEQITLEQELSTIENYLELQKVRFPEKFDYHIHVDDHLDQENIFVPPMLAQPFIENAIEHGIKHRETKGNISISYTRNGHGLTFAIEDDGIGRKKAGELRQKFDKDHKSLATSITQERIKVINRKLRHKITMEIVDLKDEQGEARGTRVAFGMPV